MTEDSVQVKLLAYLKQHVQGFPNNVQTISVKHFSHGQSCPTYLLEVCLDIRSDVPPSIDALHSLPIP